MYISSKMDFNMFNALLCVFLSVQETLQRGCTYTRTESDLICDCSGRDYKRVPRRILRNTTILDFSQNNIPLLRNNSFNWLTNLRSLKLSYSNIAYIESAAFEGLTSLTYLDLSSNFLENTTIPSDVFRAISQLTYLDITSNFQQFHSYPDHTFKYLSDLQELRVTGYDGAIFGAGFDFLRHLSSFSIEPCTMTQLKNDTFINFKKVPITTLWIKCRINRIETDSLAPFIGLNHLSIVDNNFIKISDLLPILSPLKGRNMSEILFSGNHRVRTGADILGPEHFKFIGDMCVQNVSLSHNQIAIIKTGSIRQLSKNVCLQKFDISKNNIYGQMGSAWEIYLLNNLREIDISEQSPLGVMDSYATENDSNETRSQLGIGNVKRAFVSFPLPPRLETIQAVKLVIKSSPLINIHVINGHSMKYFDMSYTNFSGCDGSFIGMDNLQFFGMSGFICEKLNKSLLSGFKNLESLSSADASLGLGFRHDKNGEFLKGLNKLKDVDLSGNGLHSLHFSLFQSQYISLARLRLSRNFLNDIPIKINRFQKLVSIDIRDNRIRFLSEATTRQLDDLFKRSGKQLRLYIDRNLFECNCDAVHFIRWIFSTQINLDSGRNYSCLFIDGSYQSTMYAFHNINDILLKCQGRDWLILSAALSFLMIVLIVLSSIGYKYRITLHYWYLSVRRKYRLYQRLVESNDYKYDAFVAYHSENYSWVCGPLLNYLEKEKGLTLCVHDRDFALGQYIADNIFDAISESRKVIFVVTKNFFDSKWCEYELDMARMKMFRQNNCNLILVLLENISTKDMPKSLLQIWSKITCLEADESSLSTNDRTVFDDLFWKRLYEAVIL